MDGNFLILFFISLCSICFLSHGSVINQWQRRRVTRPKEIISFFDEFGELSSLKPSFKAVDNANQILVMLIRENVTLRTI